MYSQHQEDDYIGRYLTEGKIVLPQTVVDVGAGDGLFLSNSRLFTQVNGFDALLIEPTPEQFFQLKDLYDTYPVHGFVKCVNEAVSDRKYKYSLETKGHWTVNRIVENPEGENETKLLSELLKEHKFEDVGLLSIDIEGLDIPVLRELITNSAIRPSLILIEGPHEGSLDEIKAILGEEYVYLNTFSFNHLFIHKKHV